MQQRPPTAVPAHLAPSLTLEAACRCVQPSLGFGAALCAFGTVLCTFWLLLLAAATRGTAATQGPGACLSFNLKGLEQEHAVAAPRAGACCAGVLC